MARNARISAENAREIARDALLWLLQNEELLPVFLGSTGAGAEDMRAGAQDPDFLASVLDFLLMDDAWIVAFCSAAGLSPDAPLRARHALPGAAQGGF